jgi:hypothetical protein
MHLQGSACHPALQLACARPWLVRTPAKRTSRRLELLVRQCLLVLTGPVRLPGDGEALHYACQISLPCPPSTLSHSVCSRLVPVSAL